jgi:hypothetical protein
MRIQALKNGYRVVIVGVLYEGKDQENLKAIYVDEDGAIDVAVISDFTVTESRLMNWLVST